MSWPQLANPPILEAVIEIRPVFAREPGLDALRGCAEAIVGTHPAVQDLYRGQLEVTLSATGETDAKALSGAIGFRSMSADNTQIVTFSSLAFSVSLLKPYAGWDALLQSAKRYWDTFSSRTSPDAVARIGVRYINELLLPPMEPVESFVVPGPSVPQGLPQQFKAYLNRIEIVDAARDQLGIITMASQGLTPDRARVRMLLDVDAICEGTFPTSGEDLWRRTAALRQFKNDMFFHSITENLLREYR